MSRNAYGQRFVHPAMTAFEALTVEGATFGYDEVVDYQVSSVVERDWDGQLLCSAIYGFASALFVRSKCTAFIFSRLSSAMH